MNQAEGAVTAFDTLEQPQKVAAKPLLIADFISLTKPRILVLLLISTCCPMVLAAGGDINVELLIAALVGGSLISGSASAVNCIYDRDIDSIMERTKNRPMAAGRISLRAAFVFASILGIGGFITLWIGLGPLAAMVALFGHWFYVVVYTMWLKRSTPQNIVIGGAAGAIPPIVGWVGVTGRIDLDALLQFLMVFLWTPPHFWALALNRNQDYQRAGVPMLPVVAGEDATVKQMFWYAVTLVPVSIALVYSNKQLGWFSYLTFSALGLIFVGKIFHLQRCLRKGAEMREKAAWEVFGFSVIYLGLYFACLVLDSTLL